MIRTESAAVDAARAAVPARRRRVRVDALAWALLSPAIGLLVFAYFAPLVIFIKNSFYTYNLGHLSENVTVQPYLTFATSAYWHRVLFQTIQLAGLTTVLAICVGYPLAYALWRLKSAVIRMALAIVVFSPLVISSVVRAYGWQVLLSDNGAVNFLLSFVRHGAGPVHLIYNQTGVLIALVHLILPFVVFPIYVSLTRVDSSVLEAARDLGANWPAVFRRITLPLSLPGLVTAANISFSIGLGIFVVPALIGGGRVLVLPVTIFQDTSVVNWPSAAVGGLVLLALALLAVALFSRLLRFSSFA
jgi:putative spermidine/putrescine transport system permease protein